MKQQEQIFEYSKITELNDMYDEEILTLNIRIGGKCVFKSYFTSKALLLDKLSEFVDIDKLEQDKDDYATFNYKETWVFIGRWLWQDDLFKED